MAERIWLMLTYTVPRQPTSKRVYVWRKLKRLGALTLQDAAWVLPATEATREHMRWLAAEIDELGGEAMLWEARLAGDRQDRELVRRFTMPVETEYRRLLTGLKKKGSDLAILSRQYQQIQAQDYFRCELGARVRAALLKRRGGHDS